MNGSALISFASALLGSGLALSVLLRETKSIANLSFVAGMLLLAIESAIDGLGFDASVKENVLYWQSFSRMVMALLPGTWLIFSLSYARGNYREFLARWRIPILLGFVLPVALIVLFRDDLILDVYQSELGGEWRLKLGRSGINLNILFLLGSVLILMNLEHTFRTSVGTMRWRIKFMVLGLGLLFVIRIYTSSQALLFHAVDSSIRGINGVALLVACLFIIGSLFRAKLFNIDIYPSHAFLYNSLTALLVGVYLLIVGVLANIVKELGGSAAFPLKAFFVLVSLVLLTVLLLSERFRQRLKRFVSRHLQRPFYDYRMVWSTFTERTSSLMDDADFCRAVTKWVSETFHVLSVTIWIADAKNERLNFGASTSLTESKARNLLDSKVEVNTLFQALRKSPFPVDIDDSKESWVQVLKMWNPDYFRTGGNRVCVPLVVRGEMLGLMSLGDRVGNVPFSAEDMDLLKCIGDQVAGDLLNLRLSRNLLEAKEMEAFQTMSAFFVHDLKNTASTLSLMLQNMEAHFEDPAFRADAMRAVSKSVTHINGLISRLSLLREELPMQPVLGDLNEMINATLASIGEIPGVKLRKMLGPIPKLAFDPEQMRKVITNLVLNAKEALSKDGEIRVETAQLEGLAVISVSDNGCGMSREFITRSLFRPFQTTKKKGTGIGMFHSKMIVDAHQGKIEVESDPGNGTTFRILLPII